MPEYLAPGVFVEETRFRSKGIEGVGTSTAGFVGMSRRGVAGSGASRVPSVAEFERQLGSAGDFQIQPSVNYLARAGAEVLRGRRAAALGGGGGYFRESTGSQCRADPGEESALPSGIPRKRRERAGFGVTPGERADTSPVRDLSRRQRPPDQSTHSRVCEAFSLLTCSFVFRGGNTKEIQRDRSIV
jgi:hypothetical protein